MARKHRNCDNTDRGVGSSATKIVLTALLAAAAFACSGRDTSPETTPGAPDASETTGAQTDAGKAAKATDVPDLGFPTSADGAVSNPASSNKDAETHPAEPAHPLNPPASGSNSWRSTASKGSLIT